MRIAKLVGIGLAALIALLAGTVISARSSPARAEVIPNWI